MAVAESAPQANMRSVCVTCTAVDSVSTDIEHHAGLSAIAESLVELIWVLIVTTFSLMFL